MKEVGILPKLQRSKQRIDMLGFFSEVEIDTKPIDGVPDQVELDIKVAERATGNVNLGIGYSTSSGYFYRRELHNKIFLVQETLYHSR